MTCAVDTCTKPLHCGGFCSMHYARFVRHGDPLYRKKPGPAVGFTKRVPGEPRYFDKHSGYVNTWDPSSTL